MTTTEMGIMMFSDLINISALLFVVAVIVIIDKYKEKH